MTITITPQTTAWLALDADTLDMNIELVKATHGLVKGYKVHVQAEADLRHTARLLRTVGAEKLWWDRKSHDTPETVRKTIEAAHACGFNRITIHASGGIEMMMAAVNIAVSAEIEVFAVTALTSINRTEAELIFNRSVRATVLQLARMARMADVTGLICSAKEVATLNSRRQYSTVAGRPLELAGLKLTVPGTRTITTETDDQQRTGTARDVFRDGADEIVLGREVWQYPNPVDRIETIYQQIVA